MILVIILSDFGYYIERFWLFDYNIIRWQPKKSITVCFLSIMYDKVVMQWDSGADLLLIRTNGLL